jgi:hypothetical protein
VRIDDVIYAVPRNGSDHSRSAESEFTLPDEVAPAQRAIDDIVQLTLGRDGIWEVGGPVSSVDATMGSPAHDSTSSLPRVARLYHSFLRRYSPEGILHAIEQSRGLMVDLYV